MHDPTPPDSSPDSRRREAFREGREAGRAGETGPEDCPYDAEPLKVAWLNGYLRGATARAGGHEDPRDQ
jgi:ribosome modulation factor